MKFEALPITVVDNNGHVNDLVQRLDDPDELAQQGHHPLRNTATVEPSQFSADEHDMHKNGHLDDHGHPDDDMHNRDIVHLVKVLQLRNLHSNQHCNDPAPVVA